MPIKAVLFDFGGVILSSPFEAFAALEERNGLPPGIIRRINSTDPDTNAWAQLERSELTVAGFVEAFEAEAAREGHPVDGWEVIEALRGDVRPAMVEVVRRCAERFKTGLLTNNFVTGDGGGGMAADPEIKAILDLFDVIVESSRIGVRKPTPAFYEHALRELEVEASQAVFLDDLGVNLKPAQQMGMQTIKVTDPAKAITDLEQIVGIPLR
jgi:putative hydrolase of the HAD superfamily